MILYKLCSKSISNDGSLIQNICYTVCIAKKLINVNITENIYMTIIGNRRLTGGIIKIENVAINEK
jgi:hypothetical protein